MVEFQNLEYCDLIKNEIYSGGSAGTAGDDPISQILRVGNSGGVRYKGSLKGFDLKYVVLYSSLVEKNWPDEISTLDILTYYGDRKKESADLHSTHHKGNLLFKECFDRLHRKRYCDVPPFFVFVKEGKSRNVIFKGLAVPGALDMNNQEDLIAYWVTSDDASFLNYKATFTILRDERIRRQWLNDLMQGNKITENTPGNYLKWLESGNYI